MVSKRNTSDVCFWCHCGYEFADCNTGEDSQERKCCEISNPEADLQLITPPANQKLFKSQFTKARKMNDTAETRGNTRSSLPRRP